MLHDAQGLPVRLGSRLGGGGEGDVFDVPGTDLVAKIFHPPDRTAERLIKLRVMIAAAPEDPTLSIGHRTLCWPTGLLHKAGYGFTGFLMPRLDIAASPPLNRFLFPQFYAPGLNWRHQLEIAANLAGGLAAVHAAGYVIGDLNYRNVHVSPQCLVTFVDCDSIQVRDPASGRVLRCPVGMPEYTAPELQNVDFTQVDRSEASDTFALAVMICQLLLVGSHPFSGGRCQTREENIAAGDSFLLAATLPQGVPPPSIVPPAVLDLLLRCFRAQPYERPKAAAFARALADSRQQVTACARQPARHAYGTHLKSCPWCDYERQLGADPYAGGAAFAPRRSPGRRPAAGTPSLPPPPGPQPPRRAPGPGWLTPPLPAALALAFLVFLFGLSFWQMVETGLRGWAAYSWRARGAQHAPRPTKPPPETLPEELRALLTQADQALRNGDWAWAVDRLQKAQEMRPEDAAIRDKLATARWQLTRNPKPGKPAAGRSPQAARPGFLAKARAAVRFVSFQPAAFTMGCTAGDADCEANEKPAHRVTLSRPFELARFETTNAVYRRCVEAGVCAPPAERTDYDDPGKSDRPVAWVSWEEAGTFCRWLDARLPTEAEWEMAARGPEPRARFPFPEERGAGSANSLGTGGLDRWAGPSPVGAFPANSAGLYDMGGNVREWVRDSYGLYGRADRLDPGEERDPRLRVTRGGGWNDPLRKLRVSAREGAGPAAHSEAIGFRCAR